MIKGFLHYWLHAVNEHALQAPYVYTLYCDVIRRDESNASFKAIEAKRQTFLQCNDRILTHTLGAPSHVSLHPEQKVRSIARHGLSSPKFSRLLYRLAVYQKSEYIIELGTSLGINTLYLSQARPKANVYTFEGSAAVADQAERIFDEPTYANIRLVRGNIDQTLPEVLSRVPRVDLAFLDANHRYEPTLRYFEQLVLKTNNQSVIVVDDIYWSEEMQQAWQAIKQHPTVTMSLDLFDAGMVLFTPLKVRQDYTLMF